MNKQRTLVVVFIDITGSTRLYETLGDEAAKQAIQPYLDSMMANILRHGGTIIKTIGDEVMCRFEAVDAAIDACCDIQQAVSEGIGRVRLSVHIGLHYGPVIEENNDVFGDAVNVAARITSISRARQILLSEDSVNQLSPLLRAKTRHIDSALVKGKKDELNIYEFIWEEECLTRLSSAVFSSAGGNAEPKTSNLTLTFNGQNYVMTPGSKSLVVGRDAEQVDLVITAPFISRVHALIEYHRDKYVLRDQSTNGTFVRTQEGQAISLRREDLPLMGVGVISFGTELTASNAQLVYFKC